MVGGGGCEVVGGSGSQARCFSLVRLAGGDTVRGFFFFLLTAGSLLPQDLLLVAMFVSLDVASECSGWCLAAVCSSSPFPLLLPRLVPSSSDPLLDAQSKVKSLPLSLCCALGLIRCSICYRFRRILGCLEANGWGEMMKMAGSVTACTQSMICGAKSVILLCQFLS